MFSIFKKKKKREKRPPYKGIAVGISRGFRFHGIVGFYCTNCYYGVRDYQDLRSYNKNCPQCNAILNWDNLIDETFD